jgi:hypothetical protein
MAPESEGRTNIMAGLIAGSGADAGSIAAGQRNSVAGNATL